MYKLVIVDDEQDVRLRLQSLIQKANHSFEIVGLFENGIEAYDGILSLMPELVITDIKIPYIDGLQTIKRVREVLPLIKSIVITGFDEFDYAKEAANLGVLAFISKPLSQEDVEKVLRKAEEELNREFSLSENLKQLEDFHQKSLPIIRENNLCRLLAKDEPSEAFIKKLENDGIDLNYPYMALAVADFDDCDAEYEQFESTFTAIKMQFEEDTRLAANVFTKANKLYLLLKSHSCFTSAELESMFLLIISQAKRFYGTSLSVGISHISKDAHNYKAMNTNALKALEYRSVFGGSKVFLYSNIQSAQPKGSKIEESEYKELLYAIKHKSQQEAQEKLQELKSKVAGSDLAVYCSYYVSNILNSIINSCNDNDALFEHYADYDIYKRYFELKTIDEIFASFEQLIDIVYKINKTSMQRAIDQNLHKITRYIEANYTSVGLCMESLSEQTGLSASYISTLFKKENTTFVKFLTMLRIEKAKQLLAHSSNKIIDISEQVGYADPYYFSHCFKKYTGISPKEYRAHENK